MIARIDNFGSKDLKTIDEITISYNEVPRSIALNEESFNNSLNIHFKDIDEAKAILNWLTESVQFWMDTEIVS